MDHPYCSYTFQLYIIVLELKVRPRTKFILGQKLVCAFFQREWLHSVMGEGRWTYKQCSST